MDAVVSGFGALTGAAVAVIQRLGMLSIPVVIAIAALVNYFGGEKAIRAVGIAIAIVAALTIVLANVTAISTWIQTPTMPAGPAAVPKPAALVYYLDVA